MAEPSVLLFGDTSGLPRLLRVLDRTAVLGLVRAEIRPEQEPELAELAADHELPLWVQPRFGSPAYREFATRVAELAPRLIVVDSYSMLLRADVLEVPPIGAVNVHYAPLPRYRGPNPLQWAIIKGERRTAVTLHRMAESVDSGEIIDQRPAPIHFDDTWLEVMRRLDALAESMLSDELPRIISGDAVGKPQDEAEATKFPRRTPDDGEIDWTWPVRRIYDLVRALVSPLPGATYADDGRRVVIDRFLTIAEVTELKFDGPGGARLDDGVLRLRLDPGGAADEVGFAVEELASGSQIGELRLALQDEGTVCRLSLDVTPDRRERTEAVGRRFAAEELLATKIERALTR